MDIDNLFTTRYAGTKTFDQHQVRTADATGFGAAADDYAERGIDLNEQLIHNKPATFFLRVRGEAMIGAGIHDGDLVIVDRSIKPQSGKIVIAVLHGDMLIRRFEKTFNKMRLLPETNRLAPIDIDPACEDFGIWGVVTYVIHGLR
ncbi:LexA family protein [Flavihumibacter fluvii]|uniref:LexA family protein n=1 Tax=Flavihumibacter fluvii TaxID=2838157 RepID=UPI001BDF6F87|nr:translesion error-prone DNA polymerase V autoproteolytic subunit [Flavihumibacter fluvii]ULQ52371.1 translesion error-prone DNA polymerase V autoproteolytic subunit [Flavihumibacter fluvii]